MVDKDTGIGVNTIQQKEIFSHFAPDAINPKGVVLKNMASGKITTVEKATFLQTKPAPFKIDGVLPRIANQIRENKQMAGLVVMAIGKDIQTRAKFDIQDLSKFTQTYPDPATFEQKAQDILSAIETSNDPQKRAEYRASLHTLLNVVYGSRYEYYQQFNLIQQEADKEHPQLAENRKIIETLERIRYETNQKRVTAILD